MKKIMLSVFLLTCSFLAENLYADDALYQNLQKIVREREANLESQFKTIEEMVTSGASNEYDVMDVLDARIRLLEYKKKIANPLERKIRIQSEIVKIAETATTLTLMKKGMAGFTMSKIDVLKAKERELAAKEELADMIVSSGKK